MLIGDQAVFAVECHHEPIPHGSNRVFGRMRLWIRGSPLGDIGEPACMLNVTEGRLKGVLARLPSLEDPSLGVLGDREAFDLIDRALYLGEDRSSDQILADASRYGRFDFLTNGGESFDRSKSFIHGSGPHLRILSLDADDRFHAALVPRDVFVDTTRKFLQWIAAEGESLARRN
jgi:hypothetical protein